MGPKSMQLNSSKINQIADPEIGVIHDSKTIADATKIISEINVSDLMVINSEHEFIGTLSEGDLIRAAIPTYEEVENLGEATLKQAFKLFIDNGNKYASEPFLHLIITDPITLSPDDELLTAATIMVQKQIRRLPVVSDGKFVGSVSRADLCQALFLPH